MTRWIAWRTLGTCNLARARRSPSTAGEAEHHACILGGAILLRDDRAARLAFAALVRLANQAEQAPPVVDVRR